MRYLIITLWLFFYGIQFITAQDGLQNLLNKYKVTTQFGFQFVSSYTLDQSIYNENLAGYEEVDNRLNFQLRRSRFVLKASPYKNVEFKIVTALDFIGRDVLSAEQAGANNGATPSFSLWDLQINYKLLNDSDALHLTGGYFHPQIGRTEITPALGDTSFDKPWAQNYVRRVLVGTGPGRAMGLNLGGQFWEEGQLFGLRYDVGIFSPLAYTYDNNSTGKLFSNLITGKIGVSIGEPESKQYSLGHKINYFNERRGITLGIQGATQGSTDLFESNRLYGFDVLLNYDRLNIDGEWLWFDRGGTDSRGAFTVNSNIKYIRLSYNIGEAGKNMIEPVLTYVRFEGPMGLTEQVRALAVNTFAGEDNIFELGCRYHISRSLRFMLAYTHNSGDTGAFGPGADFNNYLSQGGVGAIQRGDLIGASMIIIL